MEQVKNVRDWLHVADHCTAIDLIIHEGREGEIYNVGGGHNERTNLGSGKDDFKGIEQAGKPNQVCIRPSRP